MKSPTISDYGNQRFRLFQAVAAIRGTPLESELDEIEEICRAIERAKAPRIESALSTHAHRLVTLSGFIAPEINGSWILARAEIVGPSSLQLDLYQTKELSTPR